MKHVVITIGREFGSGGRIIAKRLSEELDIPFYDKEIIQEVAKRTGLSENYIQTAEQRPTGSFMYDLYCAVQSTSIPDQVFIAQSKIIKEAAMSGPCVFVGRCADYVLRNFEHCLRVFITAPLAERTRRAFEEYHVEMENLESYVNKRDKQRASYYNYFSTNRWGARDTYDLCVSSHIGIENTVAVVKAAALGLDAGIR